MEFEDEELAKTLELVLQTRYARKAKEFESLRPGSTIRKKMHIKVKEVLDSNYSKLDPQMTEDETAVRLYLDEVKLDSESYGHAELDLPSGRVLMPSLDQLVRDEDLSTIPDEEYECLLSALMENLDLFEAQLNDMIHQKETEMETKAKERNLNSAKLKKARARRKSAPPVSMHQGVFESASPQLVDQFFAQRATDNGSSLKQNKSHRVDHQNNFFEELLLQRAALKSNHKQESRQANETDKQSKKTKRMHPETILNAEEMMKSRFHDDYFQALKKKVEEQRKAIKEHDAMRKKALQEEEMQKRSETAMSKMTRHELVTDYEYLDSVPKSRFYEDAVEELYRRRHPEKKKREKIVVSLPPITNNGGKITQNVSNKTQPTDASSPLNTSSSWNNPTTITTTTVEINSSLIKPSPNTTEKGGKVNSWAITASDHDEDEAPAPLIVPNKVVPKLEIDTNVTLTLAKNSVLSSSLKAQEMVERRVEGEELFRAGRLAALATMKGKAEKHTALAHQLLAKHSSDPAIKVPLKERIFGAPPSSQDEDGRRAASLQLVAVPLLEAPLPVASDTMKLHLGKTKKKGGGLLPEDLVEKPQPHRPSQRKVTVAPVIEDRQPALSMAKLMTNATLKAPTPQKTWSMPVDVSE